MDTSFLKEHRPTDGTSARKPDVSLPVSLLAKGILRLMGWRLSGALPDVPKFVLLAGPHTSNMDGFLMLLTAFALRAKPDWMVKSELVKGPLGWLILKMGGMPINRRSSDNVVDQAVKCFNEREQIMLVISPEGTRRKTSFWRTGFYWIAVNANVPIGLGFLDYKYKRAGFHSMFTPTGNIEADMEELWKVYRLFTAKYPENYSDMKLRPYNSSPEEQAEEYTKS